MAGSVRQRPVEEADLPRYLAVGRARELCGLGVLAAGRGDWQRRDPQAGTEVGNVAEQRALERVGSRREGVQRAPTSGLGGGATA